MSSQPIKLFDMIKAKTKWRCLLASFFAVFWCKNVRARTPHCKMFHHVGGKI